MIRILEDIIILHEQNLLTVKIQTGTDSRTDGQGYYFIFPKRNKSNLTTAVWNELQVSKIGAMHFPSYAEAKERITDFAKDNNIKLNIE